MENLKAQIESILFTMGESVDIERLAGVLELSEKTVEKYLDELKKEMDVSSGDAFFIVPTKD